MCYVKKISSIFLIFTFCFIIPKTSYSQTEDGVGNMGAFIVKEGDKLIYYVNNSIGNNNEFLIPFIEAELKKLKPGKAIFSNTLFQEVQSLNYYIAGLTTNDILSNAITRFRARTDIDINKETFKNDSFIVSKLQGNQEFLTININPFNNLIEYQFILYKIDTTGSNKIHYIKLQDYRTTSVFIDPNNPEYKEKIKTALRQLITEANTPPTPYVMLRDKRVSDTIFAERGHVILDANAIDDDSSPDQLIYRWDISQNNSNWHQTQSGKRFDLVLDGVYTLNLSLTVSDGVNKEVQKFILKVKDRPSVLIFPPSNYVETVLLQTQFVATINAWAESILSSVTTYRGECFFMDAPEMLPLAKEKISMPLYAATVKLAVQANDTSRIHALLSKVTHTVTAMTRGAANRLISAPEYGYDFDERFDDMALRQSHRLGMLLNVRELATLAHFPSYSVHSEKLVRSVTRTKAVPAIATGHAFALGKNIHQDKEKLVSLSEQQRMRHMHIIGATGTGKSTLLQNLLYQDIISGNGLAVIDPHGDLIETILSVIPASRKNDVVVIDPFDSEYPVRCNILHAATDIERELISSDLVALFRRFSTSWGDQMNSVFANAILAFVESTKGGTLLDLRRFLIEKSFRDNFLQTVKDPGIIYYWQKEFPLLKSSSIGPILTKLDAFLRPKVIRNMVSQKEGLPVTAFMDTKKIVLIKLSQGLIGAENSYLLGALLVSKIHQAAMARQLQSKDDRIPFYLYIDEFQHFITPSMSEILSGARKYQLGLVLVHQSMEQVSKADTELAHALLANAGTRVCFRLGNADAKKLEEGFSYFKADDFSNLSIGEAIARVNRAEDDFSLKVQQQQFPTNDQAVKDYILQQSRRKYATHVKAIPREETDPIPVLPVPEVVQTDLIEKKPVQPDTSETNKRPVVEKNTPEAEAIVEEKKQQSEHRYLQTLIKQIAEARGYKASLEVPVPGGKVDVVLEKDEVKIAIEISVTTDITWELHNIKKCLKEPFTQIVSVSKNDKFLAAIKRKITDTCTAVEQQRVFVLHADMVTEYLLSLMKPSDNQSSTNTVKGYRVKVQYGGTTEETKTKKELLGKVLGRKK